MRRFRFSRGQTVAMSLGAVASALLLLGGTGAASQGAPDAPSAVQTTSAELPPDELILALEVPPGTTFGVLMAEYELPDRTLRQAALDTYDLARIRPDRELQLTFHDGESRAVEVRYQLDADTTLVLERQASDWSPRLEEVQYTSEQVWVGLEIKTSLWDAVLEAGLRPVDLIRIAGIFEYLVDFNTELRGGDRVQLVAEMLSAVGRPSKLGALHALRFVGGERKIEAVRFPREEQNDAYYMPDGSAVVRMFLRSPLEFSRVTSKFNPRRFHPILKTRRPHNGTDFGAPTGTPVRTVADGVVEFAGTSGGHGNFVKIRHDGTYTTSYSHLSRIMVRRGQRVSQGEHIGKVGSTGLATGPHLHYQMWKHGSYVDPMRTDLPLAKPLEPSEQAAFDELVSVWLPELPHELFVGLASEKPEATP